MSRVPWKILGGVATIAALGILCAGAALLFVGQCRCLPRFAATREGSDFSPFAVISPETRAFNENEGLSIFLMAPFHRGVAVPNGEAASAEPLGPDDWDQSFYEHVVTSVQIQGQWKRVYRTLDAVQGPYAEFTAMLQEAGLPEVYAGIPYAVDRYARAYTRADLHETEAAWNDPTLRASGSVVPLSIAAYVAGYTQTPRSVLPAYQTWQQPQPRLVPTSAAYGDMIRCNTAGEITLIHDCGSPLLADAQHFVYPVVAIHILAVCYYATNYPDVPAFAGWAKARGPDGYCGRFDVPAPADIR